MKFLALATICLAGSALALTGLGGNGTALAGGAAAPQEWFGRAMSQDATGKPHKSFLRSLSQSLLHALSQSLSRSAPSRSAPSDNPFLDFMKKAGDTIKEGVIAVAEKAKDATNFVGEAVMENRAYRNFLNKIAAYKRNVQAYGQTATHHIKIKNLLGVSVQMALANPADDVKYEWSNEVRDGDVFHKEIFGAPVFTLYVVPFVKGNSPPAISTSEESMKAVMWYGSKLYTAVSIGTNMSAAETYIEAAQKLAEPAGTLVGVKMLDQLTKEEQAAQALLVDGETAQLEEAKNLARIFREITPVASGVEESKLEWKDGQMVLDGKVQKCNANEDIFWGCCYSSCKELAGDDFFHRCNFFMCAKSKDRCVVTDTAYAKTNVAYARGHADGGVCRLPS